MDRCVIITGLSGSGKTLAGDCLEDIGFFCVDNLPVELIQPFFDLVRGSATRFPKAALVIDVREGAALGRVPAILRALRGAGAAVELVFFECSDEVLKRRFSETRRPHPMAASAPDLDAAIREERAALATIRDESDRIIDTSRFSAHELRAFLKDAYSDEPAASGLNLNVMSFGFKYGLPTEADLVFDVRFLPNPYFVEGLRAMNGKDEPVRSYIFEQPGADEFLGRLKEFVDFLVPRYVNEGKSYLTAAIGCTGGKHRSVAIAEALANHLRSNDLAATVRHRDLGRE